MPLQKHINKRNRSMKSLEEKIGKKTIEKIEQLKSKIPLKRGRLKKTCKKLMKNQNEELKLENDTNKFKLKTI